MNIHSRSAGAAAEIAEHPLQGTELHPGHVLDGRYELVELISRSAMSSIFRAFDRRTDRTVAIKVPLFTDEADPEAVGRFLREEDLGLQLNHPYILKIHEPEPDRSTPYIVMELLQGETLSARLARTGSIPEREAGRIASRVCEALDYLYRRGIVHRDLKPQNIILCTDGSLRLIDFGLAHGDEKRRLTRPGAAGIMGTPDYIAPEQVKGRRGDHRSDLYSLGVILYEMVTGSLPFEGDHPFVVMNARVVGDPVAPRERNPDLTPVMEEIILHALARDPAQRYLAPLAMQRELDDYEAVDLTDRARHLRPVSSPGRPSLRLMVLVGAILLVQAGILVAVYLSTHTAHP